MRAAGCSSSSSACTGPTTDPFTITWSACTAPSTRAVSKSPRCWVARSKHGYHHHIPVDPDSFFKQNIAFDAGAMGNQALMGGCFLRENIGTPPQTPLRRSTTKSLRHRTTTPGRKPQHQCIAHTSASSLGGLNPDLPPGLPNGLAFIDTGGHGFYHDIQRQSEYASQATVLAKLERLPFRQEGLRPGLPLRTPASTNSRRPLNSGALRAAAA